MSNKIKLGINIDHIATIRNARNGSNPDLLDAIPILKKTHCDIITIHLREDRRHIRDADAYLIKENKQDLSLNLEIAPTDEMVDIAINLQPESVCFVPEKRLELTTEGGLDIVNNFQNLSRLITKLQDSGIKVSLFIEPDTKQLEKSIELKTNSIEIHTGNYANHFGNDTATEILANIQNIAKIAAKENISVNAGHGLNYYNIVEIAKIPEILELHIGHFLIGESIFVGLENSINKMRDILDSIRYNYLFY